MEIPLFTDRSSAGKRLGEKLAQRRTGDEVVLAVPRGGIPVGVEVALILGASLGVTISRKITIPSNPEAGCGAVTEDGTVVLNEPLVQQLGISPEPIQRQAERVRSEIVHRMALFRGKVESVSVEGRTAILTDDGLASGFTMLAAVKSVERSQAARTVVAVPVASVRGYELIRRSVDDIVCLVVTHTLPFAVASFYAHWYDLSDDDVDRYLQDYRHRKPPEEAQGRDL